jgi:acyl-CoA thioesterase-1
VTRTRAAAFALGMALVCGWGCRAEHSSDSAAPHQPAVVLFFADSITRGLGLDEAEAYPAIVEQKLAAAGVEARCVNAGVSGDTTQSALSRLDRYTATKPDVVLVELSANDGMKGINRLRTRENLIKILRAFSDSGARLILAGTQFPHLEHPAYMLALQRMFEEIAKSSGAELIPDLMTGVASVPELNLEDGLHPNAEGHEHLADTALPAIERAIAKLH